MHYRENDMDGVWGFLMAFGLLAFWALAAVAVIWLLPSVRFATALDARPQQAGASDAKRPLAGAWRAVRLVPTSTSRP